jgi:hypothetical protein
MIEAGEIRQSATITTFAVGAMVDFIHGSFMTMGIDDWETPAANSFITELHLMADLGAKLKPPPWKDPGGRPKGHVKCIRFPTWLVCNNRSCSRLGKIRPIGEPTEHEIFNVANHDGMLGKAMCTACNGQGVGIPPRFVCICTDTLPPAKDSQNKDSQKAKNLPKGSPANHPHTGGHIEDFPWFQWCHQGKKLEAGSHRLVLKETDGLSFETMKVECLNCHANQTLAGIFANQLNIGGVPQLCKGNVPWLDNRVECGCTLKVAQRGATSIHRPETLTYISIPPVSETICMDTGEYFESFVEYYRERELLNAPNAVDPHQLATVYYNNRMVPNNFGNFGHDPARVINLLTTFPELDAAPPEAAAVGTSLVDRKVKEYEQLCKVVGTARDDFQTEAAMGPAEIHGCVESVMFVRRLREVTALTGFSRDHGGTPAKARIYKKGGIHDKNGRPDWYPAIELRGEGIFIRLNKDRLANLLKDNEVKARCQTLCNQLRLLETPDQNDKVRGPFRFQNPPVRLELHDPVAMARLLVTHTTCHLLMRELTLECGYSSSSLKERLYFDKDCFGFLIYASTPGADGTRGGLVRMGEKSRLKPIFESCLEKARWCSSDPICATCHAQGTDSLNMAGCHACALLPETSCELRNQFLDRCIVVKSEAGGLPGFFD